MIYLSTYIPKFSQLIVIFALVIVPILAIISMLNFARDIGRPFGGFLAVYRVSSDAWSINSSTFPNWEGMRHRDKPYEGKIITIDGHKYDFNQAEIYNNAYLNGKNFIRMTIERDNQLISQEIPVVLFTVSRYFDLVSAGFITGLGLWLLGLVIYNTNPTDKVNQLFALTTVFYAANQLIYHNNLFRYENYVAIFLDYLEWVIVVPLLGVLAIHLALEFPKPYSSKTAHRLIIAFYYLTFGIMVFYTMCHIIRWTQGRIPIVAYLEDTIGYQLPVFLATGSQALMVFRYIYLAWTDKSRRLQYQLVVISLGMICSFSTLLRTLLDAFDRESGYTMFFYSLDLRYFRSFVPLVFAYAILRYRNSQTANRPLMFVTIMTFSAIFANFVDATWRQFQPELNDFALIPPFIPLFTLTCAFGTFATFYSSLSGPLARLFHRDAISYEAVNQFGQRLLGNSDLRNLPLQIAQSLINELHLEKAAVWLWQADKQQFVLSGWAGEWQPPTSAEFPPPEFELLEPLLNPNDKTQYLGWLALGKRWDEEVFDPRDRTIANLIAQQAALFLLTAMQIAELRHVPQRISEAQERERYKLAQELHDTIQQFLGRLPFYLEVSRSAVSQAPSRAETILQQCIDDVAVASRELRFIRHNLATEQLTKGLTQPVIDLVQRLRLRYHLAIELTIDPQVDPMTDLEARQALYRVVQQLLDNIVNHAKATQVTIAITVTVDGQQVEINITDNGVGFSAQRRAQAKEGGHFGLASMESRLTSLGGELQIISTVGQGTELRGWLPGQVL